MAHHKGGYEVDEDGQIDRTPGPRRPTRDEKRAAAARSEDLAEILLAAHDAELEHVPLSPVVRDALREGRRVKARTAHRRQLQFIGKLLRSEDLDAIEATIGRAGQVDEREQVLGELERWRTRIIDDEGAIEAFVEAYPDGDRRRLRQARRNVLRAKAEVRGRQARKALFQILREAAGVS